MNRVSAHATPIEIDTEIARLQAVESRLLRELEINKHEIDRLRDAYIARGGWTRAFLVDNNDGHVHSTPACSTCKITTQFSWLTDQSGKTEDEIIEAAGELACTVCFPKAPANPKPGTIRRTDQVERDERAAAKAAKRAEQGKKAIFNPDGTPLVLDGSVVKTERAAELAGVAALADILWYGEDHPSVAEWVQISVDAARAIAAKREVTPNEITTLFAEKAKAKHARDTKAAEKDRRERPGFYAQFEN